MSSVRRLPVVVGALLSFVALSTTPGFAAETAPAPPPPFTPANAHTTTWDASLRAGYGSVFTSGVSYLGTGLGASIGHVFGSHLRLDFVGLVSSGQEVRASNAALTYKSEYSSIQSSLGIAYELRVGLFRFRPGIRGGLSVIDGHTRLGTSVLHDAHWEPIMGPCLESLVRVGLLELGVVGEAFFLPNWPAAPTAGIYGLAGIAF